MPRQKITQAEYPNRQNWCARASVRNTTCRIAAWICPDCGTANVTKLVPGEYRASTDNVKARCGKCHGTSRTLLTADDRTIKP